MQHLPLDLKIALVCVFLQAGLTFYAAVRMGMVRVRTIREQGIKLRDVALDGRAYPEAARQQANNLSNQFEFPLLMYVAVVLAAVLEASSMPFALALVGYVITRFQHRMIHVGTNRVHRRFQVFLAGLGLLFLAWVFLALGILKVM